MQHYNNVHFYGQLTAAEPINALSNAHQWNANAKYERPAKQTVNFKLKATLSSCKYVKLAIVDLKSFTNT